VPAFVLDLDGTLIDSVYQHVFAWHTALERCGYDLPMWRIHRKIGMSGGLLMNALAVELDRNLDEATSKRLEEIHSEEFTRLHSTMRPFEGACELLKTFRRSGVRCAIASSGHRRDIDPLLQMLDVGGDIPVVSKEDAQEPKPDPQLFLKAAALIDARSEETMVVGDSVWDMLAARRAHFLGVGLLTGGYAEAEMTAAGAYRVFTDPEQLRQHLHETGVNVKAGH
jgi:HAD superfamily hydrolase (TIGR01549 family)